MDAVHVVASALAMDAIERIHERARAAKRHIVLPEGHGAADGPGGGPGRPRRPRAGHAPGPPRGDPGHRARQGVDLGAVELAEPPGEREVEAALRACLERVRHRGITPDEAREHLKDALLWAALGVATGRWDGMVAGARSTTAATLRAALRGVGACARGWHADLLVHADADRAPGSRARAGSMLFADCGVNPDPSAVELAEIALLTAESAREFLPASPRVALLSFSTKGSADHPRVAQGRGGRAHRARRAAPIWPRDGELQLDAALRPRGGGKQGAGQRGRRRGRTCSSSPTSTPATSATSSWSGSRARAPWARSFRGSAAADQRPVARLLGAGHRRRRSR